MSHSNLATYVRISPNQSSRKGYDIDTLTPHFMGGNCTIETCAGIFAPTSRQASSNYGIGSDGRIGVYVEEEDRAWTSGSWANDCRAITFECANLGDGSLTDACWNSLVNLCADICRRYGFVGVEYNGTSDHTRQRDGYMLLTMHRWFQDTDCPGDWLATKFGQLAKEVNVLLGSGELPDVKPANNTRGGQLVVDGVGGYNTILDMQHQLHTYEDGCISGQWYGNRDHFFPWFTQVEWGGQGSPMVKALQINIGAGVDGIWGKETSTKFQEHLNSLGYECAVDGIFGPESIKALQRCLNEGRLRGDL